MQEGQRKTEATLVAERLRDEITRGLVAPDSKLKLAALAERYGIGRAPLREAASKLAAEQLLVFEDHRGYRVAPISRADLVDVTETRQRIEALALADSITHGDDVWEGEVMAALHRLSRTSNVDPTEEGKAAFTDRHEAFHRALCAACPSTYLLRFRETLYAHSQRYRALAEDRYRRVPGRDVAAEHEAIAAAAVERKVELACELLQAHLERTAQTLIESYPEVFGDKPSGKKKRTNDR